MMERIYHTWDKWECYPAGFYETRPPRKDMTTQDCKEAYAAFLSDIKLFEAAMDAIRVRWPNSCEHYLSNERMNRIAWLGQAAMCHETRVPSVFCGGYFLLDETQRHLADLAALNALNMWLLQRGENLLSLNEAASKTEANLY